MTQLLDKLTEKQVAELSYILNIGVQQAAEVLNEMVQTQIRLDVVHSDVSRLDIQQPSIYQNSSDERLFSAVALGFKGPFSGNTALIFPTQSVPTLVPLLFGEEPVADIEEVKVGILTELGNIVLNGIMGAIGNKLKKHFEYAVPIYTEERLASLMSASSSNEQVQLVSHVNFNIEKLQMEGKIILYFDVGTLDDLINMLQ